jgi:hypothetical protein
MTRKLYQLIASKIDAAAHCKRDLDNPSRVHESFLPLREEWLGKHREMAGALTREFLPSGSGFDNGTSIYLGESTGEKLVFATSFHHMDDGGSYDGWTDHKVTVRASLIHGFELTISGKNRNGIKELIADSFHTALSTELSREDEIEIAARLGHMEAPVAAKPLSLSPSAMMRDLRN